MIIRVPAASEFTGDKSDEMVGWTAWEISLVVGLSLIASKTERLKVFKGSFAAL